MKKLIIPILAVIIILFLVIFSPIKTETNQDINEDSEIIHGEIIQINSTQTLQSDEIEELSTNIKLKIKKGSNKDEIINIEVIEDQISGPQNFEEGDELMITAFENSNGEIEYFITDFVREKSLLTLFAIFVVIVVAVTQWQGVGSLFGMVFSFTIIFKIILPLLLNGFNPILAAIIGAVFITPMTFYLGHGVSKKTTIAVIGTLITVTIAGLLAVIFSETANLTGLASEEAAFLSLEAKEKINFEGLVLAGMIISILGILDDITISQSSVVHQLKAAKKKIKFKELFQRSMSVGRDHISSMVNTLVLIYTGASLPLLMLFMDSSQNFQDVVNLEFLAEEIIQTLVGSIGIILAVPITTILACLIVKKVTKEDLEHSGCSHCH